MGAAYSALASGLADRALNLDEIQGNIVGFNKDFQTFLFIRFPAQPELARQWLAGVIGDVATGAEVQAFNNLFKQLKGRRRGHEGTIKATWLNVAFTHKGLVALGAPGHANFPGEFREGMRNRTHVTGDTGESHPTRWVFPADKGEIHALILLAADSQADLNAEAVRQIRALTAAGIQLVHKQDGSVRQEQPGHEHFGYRDGISQPPRDTWAGEIVITDPGQGGASATAGDAITMPDWVENGSFLVFRRLRQRVPEFRRFVRETAPQLGLSPDLLGAKLVGRYPSGAPLAALDVEVAGANKPPPSEPARADPGPDNPTLPNINAFGYNKYDPQGALVPLAAHIRKVDPRDQFSERGEENRPRRILRRGLPFGQSYRGDVSRNDPQGGDAAFPDDRGLLFICYQNSIRDKFEFLQRRWANDPIRPGPDPPVGLRPGHDPLIGQPAGEREFDLPGIPNGHLTSLPRWVVTTGGDYFFSPSIAALCLLAGKPCPSSPESAAVSEEGATAMVVSSLCTIKITTTVTGLPARIDSQSNGDWRGYRWGVTLEGRTIWESNEYNDLAPDRNGIAVGVAEVSVRKLLSSIEAGARALSPAAGTPQRATTAPGSGDVNDLLRSIATLIDRYLAGVGTSTVADDRYFKVWVSDLSRSEEQRLGQRVAAGEIPARARMYGVDMGVNHP